MTVSQTTWQPLEGADLDATPALASYDGALHLVQNTRTGVVATSTSKQPGVWSGWSAIGPQPGGGALAVDDQTPPLLLAASGRLWALVRGADDNLHLASKQSGAAWSDWQALTNGGVVTGRLSAVYSGGGGGHFHVAYVTGQPGAEQARYQRFDQNWKPDGDPLTWKDAEALVLGTDAVDEVVAVVQPASALLRVFASSRGAAGWSDFHEIAGRLAQGPRGAYFDLSNVVHFAGSYHFAAAFKYCYDDVSGQHGFTLSHSRVFTDRPDQGDVRTLSDYRPAGQGHPECALALYRNKLIAAWRDEQAVIRYARWDSADDLGPWIPWYGDAVAGGRSRSRPALATHFGDRSAGNAYGDDLFAAARGANTNWCYVINFSRTIFKQYLHQIGIDVSLRLDESAPAMSSAGGRLHLALRARDNQLRIRSSDDGVEWPGDWTDLGGAVTRRATPGTATFEGSRYLFVTTWDSGHGRRVQVRSCDATCEASGAWSAWRWLPPMSGGREILDEGPVAVTFGKRVHVFVLTKKGLVNCHSDDGTTWSAWRTLPSPPDERRFSGRGASAGGCVHDGRIHLFARIGPKKGHMVTLSELVSDVDGNWSGSSWHDLQIESPSEPAAVSFQGALHLFARSKWNGLFHNKRTQGWSGWSGLPGGTGLTPSGPTATVFGNQIVLAIRGFDYELRFNRSGNGAQWSGWSPVPVKAAALYGPFESRAECLPAFSEIGYAMWVLPHWMMGHILRDRVKATPAEKHAAAVSGLLSDYGTHVADACHKATFAGKYPFWINFSQHAWMGGPAGITTNYAYDYKLAWHELAHALLGSWGVGVEPDAPNLEPGLSPESFQEMKLIFGLPHPKERDGSRPLGFTGWYTVGIQHDLMDAIELYFKAGDKFRTFIAHDKQHGVNASQKDLLQRKYWWVREHIFHGVEFSNNNNPLPPAP